jgi:enoyl-CoA hydratase/carnithine racemase
MAMEYQEIRFERSEPIGFVTLAVPEKANALSVRMVQELTDVWNTICGDESLKVIILRGEGKHFCAGHYLAEMVGKAPKETQSLFARCTAMMKRIHEIPQPVIAQVQGVATAAGCQLVAWCDLVVAEEGARFATPGVRIGLFCTTPMVAITRAIGRKAAMEMLLTGRFFPAEEAKQLGLVNRVVKSADLADETEAMAAQIAEASGYVLGIGKRAFYAQIDQSDDKAFLYANQTIALNNLCEDAQTGIQAFLDKETPTWKNR